MCVDGRIQQFAAMSLSRRRFLTGATVLAGTAATSGLAGAKAAGSQELGAPLLPAATAEETRLFRTYLVLLGTSGGPRWWMGTTREGIASALVVNDAVYLVDCGEGVGKRYIEADLPRGPLGLEKLRGIFLTHLHSDHIIDYFNIPLLGWFNGIMEVAQPVQVYGPGDRASLPPIFGSPPEPPPVINPENPTPGTVDTTNYFMQAYATDINDRMRDNARLDLRKLIDVHDIALPEGVVSDPNVDPAPPMDPFFVHEDENVRVTATLVYHAPVFPSFAFRFDTEDGSVVFSGDTAVSENLIKLAHGPTCSSMRSWTACGRRNAFPRPRVPPRPRRCFSTCSLLTPSSRRSGLSGTPPA